ncbi:MAG: aldehyde dehydrogenase family protein [Dehalococcoidia bacterium]
MSGRNYIDGQWLVAHSERTFERRNPARHLEVLGVFPRSGRDDAHRAVLASRSAYPQSRKVSRIRRGEYLNAFVQLVKTDTEALARLMAVKSGKPLNEAWADVIEGIHTAQRWSRRAA